MLEQMLKFIGERGERTTNEDQNDDAENDNDNVVGTQSQSQNDQEDATGDNTNVIEDVEVPFDLSFGLENPESHKLLVVWASEIQIKSPGEIWTAVTNFEPKLLWR